MKRSNEELKDEFMNIQHKGKQTLRIFLLLFLFLLLFYCGTQGYLTSLLYEDFYEHTYVYLWKIALQLFWLIPVWQLWKYRRFGKLLYFICMVLTLYICKDMYVFITSAHSVLTSYMYFSLGLACGWRLFLILGFVKLFHNPKIRSIWSVYDMFDDELNDEEDRIADIQPEKPETPLEKKAKQHLHAYAIKMGFMLFAYILIVLISLLILKDQLPQMKESLDIIERTLYGCFLFTAFLWIMPISAMYMYHRSTRWLLAGCFMIEIVKVIVSFDRYIYIVTSPLVTSFGRIIFMIIELLRFVILLWWSINVIRDPYSYHYWKKEKN